MAKKLRTFISGQRQAQEEADRRNSRARTLHWSIISGYGQGVNGPIFKLDFVHKKTSTRKGPRYLGCRRGYAK